MAEILASKAFLALAGGLVGGAAINKLTAKPPKAPDMLAAPSYANNSQGNDAASALRKRQMAAGGRKSTLLSLGSDQATQAMMGNAPKSLLGG